jgi:hypothetical protein
MKNVVLFCTSPLQVVNAKAAIDYLNDKDSCCRELSIIITHPNCTDITKRMILELADNIGCKCVIDLTMVIEKALTPLRNRGNNNSEIAAKNSSVTRILATLTKGAEKRVNTYRMKMDEVSKIIAKEIGEVHEVFCRASYKVPDGIFLLATSVISDRYLIEDGHGEHLPKYWSYRSLNFYNIFFAWRHQLRSWPAVIMSTLMTRDYRISKAFHFRPKLDWLARFTNLPQKSSIDLGPYFVRNVEKLYVSRAIHEYRKVIIFGTRVVYPKYKITKEREVEIYNKVICWIIETHGVSESQIWYKPHPRTSIGDWQYKENNLSCRVWDIAELDLGEIELLNPMLKAVYSMGSTSLVYAKVLFGKESGIIDITNEGVHPSDFAVAHTVAEKFNIPKVPQVW